MSLVACAPSVMTKAETIIFRQICLQTENVFITCSCSITANNAVTFLIDPRRFSIGTKLCDSHSFSRPSTRHTVQSLSLFRKDIIRFHTLFLSIPLFFFPIFYLKVLFFIPFPSLHPGREYSPE